MKVLIADAFEASGLEGLKAAGCEVIYAPGTSGDDLVRLLQSSGAEVLVVRSTRVTEAILTYVAVDAERRPRPVPVRS